jgi:CRISPR-associated protein Csb2
MLRALLLSIYFHDGRYHGRPEWPPSPARLFQALVAGVASGKTLSAEDRVALAWLEQREPPVIAAPAKRDGGGFINYVPNNDLDSVGRDPHRVAEIRAGKLIKPLLFDARIGLLYAWTFDDGEEHAQRLCGVAERLYQLGRGVDMAWARGEISDADQVETRFAAHGGGIFRPGAGDGGVVLPSPLKGSLASLERRFVEIGSRFRTVRSGRQAQQIYSQASKPRFAPVVYGGLPQRLPFDLRELTDKEDFGAWPLVRAVELVEHIRDLAATALKNRRPDAAATVDRVFVGRDAKEADKAARIRIVPLPSIGSVHVVPAIRRVLIEVPPNCPFSGADIQDAFSGLLVSEQVDSETGEVIETRLLSAEDRDMLRNYGVDVRNGHRVWRSVTPVVLPETAARRRIDPQRLRRELAATREAGGTPLKEAKSGAERLSEERRAVAAVAQALRHAGVTAHPEAIRVQREPLSGRGARAEEFAPGMRFAKERLWHIEITFAEQLRGPLVIGDGRYLGLGLMAPERDVLRDAAVFAVPKRAGIAAVDGPALVQAARRALMALAGDARGEVPRLFSGHEDDGRRAASGRHEHVFIAADDDDGDGRIDRLIVAAPWACDHSLNRPSRSLRAGFEAVVSGLEVLRAGRLGTIALGRPVGLSEHDLLVGPAHLWESRTLYLATRHAGRRKDAAAMLVRDVSAECVRRGLPAPAVEILECKGLPNGGGLKARARLHFATAIRGPLLLGRDSHRGGGLFAINS